MYIGGDNNVQKKFNGVCLAAIMAATVVTTSVPVYAAEPVATKQETAKTRTITIKYQKKMVLL